MSRTDEVLAAIRARLDTRREELDALEKVTKVEIVVRFRKDGHVRATALSLEDSTEMDEIGPRRTNQH